MCPAHGAFWPATNNSEPISSGFKVRMLDLKSCAADGTYHALQSLGKQVGLKHVFTFFLLRAVHHFGPIVNCLFYGRRRRTQCEKRGQILILIC